MARTVLHPRIHIIRRERVMLSHDLARLYGMRPKDLVRAVKRNHERFPKDFVFQLTSGEAQSIRYQSLIYFRGRYFKQSPHAFTKPGVAMLTSILRNERAIQLNIRLMRGFNGWLTSLPDDVRHFIEPILPR